jgi:rhamnose utilization protein RhaD (predicted bifunctional aldolase and dehydrogenase)/NAD(P)-dependent dehydrogenase (short-subunit alcohol dehydrogenase family)
MKSLWNDAEAAACTSELALRAYTSRLLGRDRSLVLHGGGNTSVKLGARNVLGDEEELLYVKGSGWDLETIQEAGFTPLRLAPVVRLAELERLSDPQMVNELLAQRVRANAPAPSVESILHAILPWKYVDHTHADAVLAITNTADGRSRIEDIYGDCAVILPYVMPGFDLARLCAVEFPRQRTARTTGMILMNHGVFSFGDDARESYQRMIALVERAERYLRLAKAWKLARPQLPKQTPPAPTEIAELRHAVSRAACMPMVMTSSRDPGPLAFCRRPDLRRIASRGPATPDHSIRTKCVPLVGRGVARYVADYGRYFERNSARAGEPKTMLDPAPRVILDPSLGLCTIGRSVRDATIVREIYEHTIEVIERATALGGYRALAERPLFDVEYWDLEQAKLKQGGAAPRYAGEIALVTGAASGIGRACVEALLARGAAVVAIDRDPAVTSCWQRIDCLALRCDVTSASAVESAIVTAVARFGGLDMLILNAGIFGASEPISRLTDAAWRSTMSINADANLALMRACHPLLRLAPAGGRVVVVGSKNVPAPGPGAAAYSASKAALTQLARVAALEWGADGIRVNVVHPNAVFDTAIWTEDVLAARAAHYGVTVEAYRTNNVLKAEVRSRDVAELVVELCGPAFARTTGAQIPVDGGNERVI